MPNIKGFIPQSLNSARLIQGHKQIRKKENEETQKNVKEEESEQEGREKN